MRDGWKRSRTANTRLGLTPDEIDSGYTPSVQKLADRLEAYRLSIAACEL